MMNKCCWVTKPADTEIDAKYCNKPVRFKIVLDDDQNKVRKYNPFCDEHMAKWIDDSDEE